MTQVGKCAARRGRRLVARLLPLLSACAAIALAAAFALDHYGSAKRRRAFAESLPVRGPGSIPAPGPSDWRPAPLAAGTPAPPFSLPGVRDGRRVSLAGHRAGRPAVLLFGSFG